MTCKDCIHYVVCWRVKEVETGNPMITSYHICRAFKNESRYIELPCNVGDTVWVVFTPKHPANPNDKGKWYIVQDGVQRILYGSKGLSIETCNMGTISAKEMGRKLFLTREEAEKALKERERK